MRSLLILALLGSTAAADGLVIPPPDEPVKREPFDGLDSYGTLGLGVAFDDAPGTTSDFMLRVGKTFGTQADRWHPGGFVELHTFDFDTFDVAIGPQVQLRLGKEVAAQLRGGVGIGTEGAHALAGIHFGHVLAGASVTARRSFDTGDVVISANVEVFALFPGLFGVLVAPQ